MDRLEHWIVPAIQNILERRRILWGRSSNSRCARNVLAIWKKSFRNHTNSTPQLLDHHRAQGTTHKCIFLIECPDSTMFATWRNQLCKYACAHNPAQLPCQHPDQDHLKCLRSICVGSTNQWSDTCLTKSQNAQNSRVLRKKMLLHHQRKPFWMLLRYTYIFIYDNWWLCYTTNFTTQIKHHVTAFISSYNAHPK